MSEVNVRACSVAEVFDDSECAALLAEYEPECANPLLGATAPSRSAYESLEALRVGQCFSARLEGRLCGLAFLLIAPLPHYGRRFATVESLFATREARGAGIGILLMNAVEAHARSAGCGAILYSAKSESRLERLFLLLGDKYLLTNHVFTKSLA
jgi:GNAT superfamily N-acetyltransferase